MFGVGDRVRLLAIPDWLLSGLPEGEQSALKSFVGKVTEVTQVDSFGYVWIGFGESTERADDVFYSGHSFCVTEDCLEKVDATSATSPAAG